MNEFMTSMYFFIPLYSPRLSFTENMKGISPSPYADEEMEVKYKKLSFIKESNHTFDLTVNDKIKIKGVEITGYLLQLPTKRTNEKLRYQLLIGTELPQFTDSHASNDSIEGESLLIILKQALLRGGDAQNNVLPSLRNSDGVSYYDWLTNNILKEIEGITRKRVSLRYSLVDVRIRENTPSPYNADKGCDSVCGKNKLGLASKLLFPNLKYSDYQELVEKIKFYELKNRDIGLYGIYGHIVSICYCCRLTRSVFDLDYFWDFCMAVQTDTYLRYLHQFMCNNKNLEETNKTLLQICRSTTLTWRNKNMICEMWGLYEMAHTLGKEGELILRVLSAKKEKKNLHINWFLTIYMLYMAIITYIVTYNSSKIQASMTLLNCSYGSTASSAISEPLLGMSEQSLIALFCVGVITILIMIFVTLCFIRSQNEEIKSLLKSWHDGK